MYTYIHTYIQISNIEKGCFFSDLKKNLNWSSFFSFVGSLPYQLWYELRFSWSYCLVVECVFYYSTGKTPEDNCCCSKEENKFQLYFSCYFQIINIKFYSFLLLNDAQFDKNFFLLFFNKSKKNAWNSNFQVMYVHYYKHFAKISFQMRFIIIGHIIWHY